MNFRLEPGRGAPPLLFGMMRQNIRNLLQEFDLRTKATVPENDYYAAEGLILGYDGKNELEFIEVFPPSTAEFKEIQFFDASRDQVLTWLGEIGLTVPYDDGYNFASIGIILYAPGSLVESVSIYRDGYYDS